jgi:3-methyladenine DNA glycosylase AlkD
VKHGVNWALREIGARNVRLHRQSLEFATRPVKSDSASVRWVSRDALKKLKAMAASGHLRHLG